MQPNIPVAHVSAVTEIALAIRPAQRSDLDAINGVVEAAVMSWPLPAKLKRRALPDFHYHTIDLDVAMLLIAIGSRSHVLGVVACEPARLTDNPQERNALLLDGLFIHPDYRDHGIAGHLLDEARALARRQGRDGLLVKVRAEVEDFFRDQGLTPLPHERAGAEDKPLLWQAPS